MHGNFNRDATRTWADSTPGCPNASKSRLQTQATGALERRRHKEACCTLTWPDDCATSTYRIGDPRNYHPPTIPYTHQCTHLSVAEWSVQMAVLSEDTTQITKSLVSVIPSPPNPMACFRKMREKAPNERHTQQRA